MIVYIVTAGEYSDYHIERVFLDRKKAEQYVALQHRNSEWYTYDTWNIEEEETFDDNLVGETEVRYLYTFYYENDKVERYSEPRIVGFNEKEVRKASYGWIAKFTLEEEDDEKAQKIAEDEFAKARALEF